MTIICCQGSIVRWNLEEVERNPLYGKKGIIVDCGLQDKEMLDIELSDTYKEKKPVVVVGWEDKGVLDKDKWTRRFD